MELLKRYSFFIVLGASAILFFFLTKEDSAEEPFSEMQEIVSAGNEQVQINNDYEQSGTVFVDVKGEVNKPGVYEFNLDARVNEVIKQAGGFTAEADQTQVNLAQKVQDEMIIVIPKAGEAAQADQSEDGMGMSADKIRINYATLEELENLNGIGPSKAQAIIQYREENGFFQTPEDLLEVSGIGEKTFDSFKDDIIVP